MWLNIGMTFTITTEAATRSQSRRTRTWTIEAANEDEARYQARMNHIAVVGWNASIWITNIRSAA